MIKLRFRFVTLVQLVSQSEFYYMYYRSTGTGTRRDEACRRRRFDGDEACRRRRSDGARAPAPHHGVPRAEPRRDGLSQLGRGRAAGVGRRGLPHGRSRRRGAEQVSFKYRGWG